MTEIKHSVAEKASARLEKEKLFYEEELRSLQQKASSFCDSTDKYTKALIQEQINETNKALDAVDLKIKEFSLTQGEK
ncbi:hypothetical protein CWI42_042100 [Ordospora colligata]|uniref:Uncharacterized protein n=1 Tax=Ordospora colligata OC4 TaxID=1354746 RepID=A0A0B2UFZ2_9MICR|nr:uncharacterized protein M896_042110 [Ordospora colligata OC4]KHN70011.1 hypothetical protein M896_042110 [Ordospora colligata OC4]TBU16181.1 hypothetical protein CWI41_042100 [Ordospora colligata]TBU16394.1 hypothetical protein CWI40_042100 [Ordospora colligata]TBU19098.1 hypothetical protein CWI42_042100 [Ordospora colligata]